MLAISLYHDSEATIFRTFSKTYNGKSRHTSWRHKYIRHLILERIVTIVYVRSNKNLTDLLIKVLSNDLIKNTSMGMGRGHF